MILALDTSTSAVTVAVHDGSRVLGELTSVDVRRHTEILTPSIRQVSLDAGVTPSDLTRVVVGVGPGPFTGLRVGIVTALTLGDVLGIPVGGVCSLDALAAQVIADGGPEEFVVATDARRKEVYWARYTASAGRPVRQEGPAVAKPAALSDTVRALPVAGRGPVIYPELFPVVLPQRDVSAAHLASLAVARMDAGAELEPVRPLYLRNPDAVPATTRKSVLP